jgi:glycerophosphoryl diester phosphodiesterase
MLPAYAMVARIRRRLPTIARGHLDAGRCDAIMAHWRLVSPALVQAVADAGAELYVWTVDDAARIRALEAMGVTGVITNDPRLF